MPASTTHRLVTVLILLLWALPGVQALGLDLHLLLDHRGGPAEPLDLHQAAHACELLSFTAVLVHGHSHDPAVTPEHEHTATVGGSALALRPPPARSTRLGATPSAPAAPTRARASSRHASRCGVPAALFTVNCSLLL